MQTRLPVSEHPGNDLPSLTERMLQTLIKHARRRTVKGPTMEGLPFLLLIRWDLVRASAAML